MFGILAVLAKLNEFQSVATPRPPCDSDDVWAGIVAVPVRLHLCEGIALTSV